MFAQTIKDTDKNRLLVRLVTADPALEAHLRASLSPAQRYHLETVSGSLQACQSSLGSMPPASLLVCDFAQDQTTEWTALERLLTQLPARPAIILLSDRLSEASARRLLRLQITDWLPRDSSLPELLTGCEQALKPATTTLPHHATCLAFMSAVGGAGSTTLALAAAEAINGRVKTAIEKTCVADLDFQFGPLCDHLDLTPNLKLEELSAAPERLDAHLFEVMLSRHKSGLAILASRIAADREMAVEPAVVGQLLDLAAAKFEHLIIDLPHAMQSWTEHVLRGADRVFIVTELSVVGLRQARRLADLLEQRWNIPVKSSIIVNKYVRFGLRGMRKRHAQEILGARLAGFVANLPKVAGEAQDHGVLLSSIRRSNAIQRDLSGIVTTSAKGG